MLKFQIWHKKMRHGQKKKGYTRTTITFDGILPQTPYLPLISGELWVLWLSADSKDR